MNITFHDIYQNSKEWDEIRAPMPTASSFHKLLTPAKLQPAKSADLYACELAGPMLAGEPLEGFKGNSWTERGHALEPHARAAYSDIANLPVAIVGFVTAELEKWLIGASPDGLVGEDGLLEIKNLAYHNHIKYVDAYYRKRTIPHEFLCQVQGQMLVTDRKWCDLFLHHPHKNIPNCLIRIERDPVIIGRLESALIQVLTKRDAIYERLHAVVQQAQE